MDEAASGSSRQTNAYDFQRGRPDPDDGMGSDQRTMMLEVRLSGMLDFSKTFSISACGGLLAFLARERLRGALGDDDEGLHVTSIETFTM